MKLRIIGTGGIFSKNASACYLIDDNILIDIPNGCCKKLTELKENINDIGYVLITHFHGDHFFDIPFYFLSKSKNINSSISIFADKKGISNIKKLLKIAFPKSVKRINKTLNIHYIANENFSINNYNVEKVLVEHGSLKPCYGYIINTGEITIGFTGDSCYCNQVDYIVEKCDYIICDCSFISGNKKHMGIDNIVSLSNKYHDKVFVASHMNDNTKEELLKIKKENIKIFNDGDYIINNK